MVVEDLIRAESNGKLSFGNYELAEKKKKADFEFAGDLYKVKTFNEITKLERNEQFVYESVPGTSVLDFVAEENGVSFKVCGVSDANITLELESETEYDVYIGGEKVAEMFTNLGGKLSISVEFKDSEPVSVKVIKR